MKPSASRTGLATLGLWMGMLSGCASLPEANRAVFEKVRGYEGLALEDFRKDRGIYALRCSGCHLLPLPSRYGVAAWGKWLPPMVRAAKLSAEDETRVRRFVAAIRDLDVR